MNKFSVIPCMLLPSFEFKSVQRKFGERGKEKETGPSKH